MESLKTWWEIAQVAGAGATLILGPVAVMLWRRINKDTEYIRQNDRNTLSVLSELTKLLDTNNRDDANRHTAVLNAISQAIESIKTHVDMVSKK